MQSREIDCLNGCPEVEHPVSSDELLKTVDLTTEARDLQGVSKWGYRRPAIWTGKLKIEV
jgi:hypothetical protein